MTARRYEFYLLVLKVSLTRSHSKIKFVSPSGHAMFCLLYTLDIDEMARFKTTCFIHFRNDEKVSQAGRAPQQLAPISGPFFYPPNHDTH